jgi:hypothetical protein
VAFVALAVLLVATGLTFAAFALRMAPATAAAVGVVTWVGARKLPNTHERDTTPPPSVWVAAAVALILALGAVGTGKLHPQRVLTMTAIEFVLFVVALSLVLAVTALWLTLQVV